MQSRGCGGCNSWEGVVCCIFKEQNEMALNARIMLFYVFLYQFILLYFLRWQKGGVATVPPNHPPKSATAYINIEAVTRICLGLRYM